MFITYKEQLILLKLLTPQIQKSGHMLFELTKVDC